MFKYINFLLLAILLLIFSCDEELKPVIEGCTIETACNYNADATMDDESCTYAEENYDCDGNCTAEVDCAGVCGGDSVLSGCDNTCGSIAVVDCAGVCGGGDAVLDECGICDGSGVDLFSCCPDGTGPNGEVTACNGVCGGDLVVDDCGVCAGYNDCFGCNDWYMENFICDDTEATEATNKCCVEDDNNNDNRCKIYNTGNNCDFSPFCLQEFEMECDKDGEYCDYDGAAVGDPCSTSEGSLTEGEGLCRKYCDPSLTSPGSCFNRVCNELGEYCDPLLTSPGNCFNIVCDVSGEYCDYPGAALGTHCSTSEVSLIEGDGSCILDLSDEGEGSCILDLSDDVNISTGYITYYDTGCEDGTDNSCCTEPECDGITLSIQLTDATLRVNYLSTIDIGGFEFTLNGATVAAGSGGDADANGFDVFALGNAILAINLEGGSIPAGSGILTNLTVSTSGNQLCLEYVVFADPDAEPIVNCPEYTALWPAPGQQVECITIP